MGKTARQLQKEDTRVKIIKAAYEEFGRRGVMSTRMSDIAAAAGVSHGTVFAHFETQEALTAEVIGHYAAKIAQRTHELAQGGATVRAILEAQLAGIAEFEPFYTRLTVELRLLPAECRSAWVAIQSAVSSHLSVAAGREMAAGEIASVPVSFLFNTWMGLVSYYLVNGDLFAPGGRVIERCGDELLNNFMSLIAVKSN
jgi:AcrR family transcriptional regulator